MASLFCCSSIKPYRPQTLSHEQKFRGFIDWAEFPRTSSVEARSDGMDVMSQDQPPYAVQLVQQINFGPLESKRYFIVVEGKDELFLEITEKELIEANFKKLNS